MARFKRAYKGTYHWMRLKHLQRYVTSALDQLGFMIRGMDGKRLTLRDLVACRLPMFR